MLPFFYHPLLDEKQKTITLDEPTSKHCIQVLRMQEGEQMMLTDGKGKKLLVTIIAADRKRCGVRPDHTEIIAARPHKFALGIAFTKNNSRNEWLLEKATEMGVEEIYPLICSRSEKEKFNADRLNGILVAAMLQSQQCHLPILREPIALKKILGVAQETQQKLIAHCLDTEQRISLLSQMKAGHDTLALIGPEGDFTKEEITLCLDNGFTAVSLGANRLRTETAGLYVCTVFNALNYA
jgi:16S rRNA (uracil1498-N3)-methyltransferase